MICITKKSNFWQISSTLVRYVFGAGYEQGEAEPTLPFDESATQSAGVFDMASLVEALKEATRESDLLGVSQVRKLYSGELDKV